MWLSLVKLASLFVLGFLSLYLGGKPKETGREVAWLQRLGSCDRFHKDRDTRLAAYANAFEHSTLRSFFKPRRRGKDGVGTSAEEEALLSDEAEELVSTATSVSARVDELERLILAKRQDGWFESGVEEVLAPLGSLSRTTTVNASELAAWVALPDAMERLREMLVCSEDGSDAASRTAEAIGMLSSKGDNSEYGLTTEALLARLSSSSFQVARALLHATTGGAPLKLGAHVDSLVEMAFGASPATNQTSFIAIELLVHASRENARQILTALRRRGVDARLRRMMMDDEGALARLVAQVAHEVHEPYRLKVHDDALLSDLGWLAGWSAGGLSAVATRPRRSRHCAATSALKNLAVYPSATKAVALHAFGDERLIEEIMPKDAKPILHSLEAATSSHLTEFVFHFGLDSCLPTADFIDVLYVAENGLGLDFLRDIVELYINLSSLGFFGAMSSLLEEVLEDLEEEQQPEVYSGRGGLSSLFLLSFFVYKLLSYFVYWWAFEFLQDVAMICFFNGVVRTVLLVSFALKTWLWDGGLPVELHWLTYGTIFVASVVFPSAYMALVLLTAAVCLVVCVASPCLVVHGLLVEKRTLREVRHRCFADLKFIVGVWLIGLLLCLSYGLTTIVGIPLGVAALAASRHLADALILAPACSRSDDPMRVARLVGNAASFGFVAVLAFCSPLFDAASRRAAYYRLRAALNPAVRASASALRWLRRRPAPRKPPTQGLDACLICHETYGEEQKEDYKEFPPPLAFCRWGCGQPFHAECVAAWHQKQNVCALCGATWS